MSKRWAVVTGIVMIASSSWALPDFLDTFNARYGTTAGKLNSCEVCHASGTGFNDYGNDVSAELTQNGGDLIAALSALESLDSDGDGFTNLEEIQFGSWPGDNQDFPTPVEPVTWSAIKKRYRGAR